MASLRLLEWDNGRTILENFPQAEPSQRVVLDWQPAFAPRLSTPANPAEWTRAVAEELSAALPWWEIARARYGRTAVGVSFQPPEVLPSFAASFLAGEVPAPSEPLGSPALALRFLAADLRAFLAEAAMCNGPLLPPNQWNTCLYRHTMSGRLLVALRAAAQDSSHDGFKTVGTRFLVPTPWLPG